MGKCGLTTPPFLTEFDLINDIRQAPAEVGKQAASKEAACLFVAYSVNSLHSQEQLLMLRSFKNEVSNF